MKIPFCWAIRDIKSERLKLLSMSETDLATLIEFGLIEIRTMCRFLCRPVTTAKINVVQCAPWQPVRSLITPRISRELAIFRCW
jgi:hypothetical protein